MSETRAAETETGPRGDLAGSPDVEMPASLADVGARMREARERAGLEQRAVAEMTGVTQPQVSRWESGDRDPGVADLIRVAETLGIPASSLLPARHQEAVTPSGDGQWMVIGFFGHIEYTGYVTEITKHGQAAYRIDLPEKVFGGDQYAYVIQAASSWFFDRPVTEESVRTAWEARQKLAERRAREEAEWRLRQEQRAISAPADDDAADDDDAAEAGIYGEAPF